MRTQRPACRSPVLTAAARRAAPHCSGETTGGVLELGLGAQKLNAMPPYEDDDERFEALRNAITSTYATGPAYVRRRKRKWFYANKLVWFALGGCLVIAVAAGVIAGQWRSALQVRTISQDNAPALLAQTSAAPVTLPPYTPEPRTPGPHTPPPSTPAPTAPPTKPPTATPSPDATASPTPTASPVESPSPSATSVAVIHNAFLLVRSNDVLKVGAKGSCGGLDVTVEVRGYPKGCTVFDADSTGPLANGHGTVLVVPVSSTEDVGDVKYGLLYFRSNESEVPRFLGLIRGEGSGRVVVRLQDGLIMEQSGDRVTYYTFNGRRIVRINS